MIDTGDLAPSYEDYCVLDGLPVDPRTGRCTGGHSAADRAAWLAGGDDPR